MASHLPHLTLKLALLDRGSSFQSKKQKAIMLQRVANFLGIENFTIEYDSLTCVYAPGDVVHGHVVIQLKDAVKAKAVVVNMIGKSRTSWTVWEQYSSYAIFFAN